MRIYKPTYKDRQGEACKTHTWYIELRIAGQRHRVRGYSDKGATAAFGRKLERLAGVHDSRGVPDAEFTRWAVERGLLNSDPLARLKTLNARLDARLVRRALLPDELRKLVAAAEHGPIIRSVTGPVRALAWRLGCEAGLRIDEIVALEVRDLDLDADGGPTLTVRASVSKNRTEARLPLHPSLARNLRPFVRARLPMATELGLPASFRHRRSPRAGYVRGGQGDPRPGRGR